MFDQITIILTWRTVVRIGLVWAAEYALLALIEDSSHLLKVATLICAVAGLAVLQFEDFLRHHHKKWFIGSAVVVGFIYLGFVFYAINNSLVERAKQNYLRQLYVSVGPLLERQIPTHGPATNPQYNDDALKQFQVDAAAWEDSTQQWLLINFGPAARERFLDMSSVQTICWSQVVQGCDGRYDIPKNRLNAEKRNLSAIMETTAYSQ